ncbi:peroxidase-related enzyme [Nocardioides dubius]|uniref:Peroxidase-related enzyme n=1 Tax=Nocardioides dubius TaxID=317019 RepID=A0ABP4EF46_9ACTN
MATTVAEPELDIPALPKHLVTRLGGVDREDVSPRLQRQFDHAQQTYGYVPNWLRGYAVNEATLERLLAIYGPLWDDSANHHLTIQERELISVIVAHENECGYCVANHRYGLAQATGDKQRAARIADDHHLIDFDARDQALVDLAVKVTHQASRVGEADYERLRAVGLTNAGIVEAIEVAAFFSYANKLTQAIGLQPDATLFA